jgi:hypothetical protein
MNQLILLQAYLLSCLLRLLYSSRYYHCHQQNHRRTDTVDALAIAV